jgi:hypothetical protein
MTLILQQLFCNKNHSTILSTLKSFNRNKILSISILVRNLINSVIPEGLIYV